MIVPSGAERQGRAVHQPNPCKQCFCVHLFFCFRRGLHRRYAVLIDTRLNQPAGLTLSRLPPSRNARLVSCATQAVRITLTVQVAHRSFGIDVAVLCDSTLVHILVGTCRIDSVDKSEALIQSHFANSVVQSL